MLLIEELESNGLFKLENFKFIIGDYATYNKYYKLSLSHGEFSLAVGLQVASTGIKPQIALHDNKLLLGAGDKFYVYDFNGKLVKEYLAYPIFYEFIIEKNHILVISELCTFLLNLKFDKIWEKSFNEIIDVVELKESRIILRDYNDKLIHLDFMTGKECMQ